MHCTLLLLLLLLLAAAGYYSDCAKGQRKWSTTSRLWLVDRTANLSSALLLLLLLLLLLQFMYVAVARFSDRTAKFAGCFC
jgi:hypothetical protein